MVLGWLTVAIVVLVVLIIIFKSQDLVFVITLIKKNFFFILFILLILFLTFSFIGVYRSHEVSLTSYDEFVKAGKLYFTWFISLFGNLGKIVGYAVNQDWILQNSTNATG
jgi:hypothetical protein